MKSLVRRGALLACGGAIALAGLPAASAVAQSTPEERYLDQVSVPGITQHLEAFQRIADLNGGTRASGTPGYLASVRYVVGKLRAARYNPTVQAFDFAFYRQLAPSTFEIVSPTPQTYVEGPEADYTTMDYSGSGDVTGTLQAVDLVLPPGPAANTSTSGCEESDFDGFTAGNIALMQRGTCNFSVKVANAAAAGAVGAVIFNEGQPGRTDVIDGTLGSPADIPAVDTSFANGEALAALAQQGAVVHIATSTESDIRRTYNVIADSTLGNPDARNTIVVGAHLDSVLAGPGINDNGSGSAMILELARQLHRIGQAPENRVRFAWWGAEESNLLGSTYYVDQLTTAKRNQIKMNLNFDMVASPNGVRQVYDGDGSDSPPAGPPGSAEIEAAFNDFFASRGVPFQSTPFTGRSDYGPFIAEGIDIPAGGLFTGAEVEKTAEEAAIYGGTAGEQYDPCYHLACDTLANATTPLGLELLDSNADAAAHVLYGYSQADTLPGASGLRAARLAKARSAKAGGRASFDYRGSHLVR
jgi:aminopeptidase Y